MRGKGRTDLVDGEVEACVGNDADEVGDVSAHEVARSFVAVDLSGAVENASVLLRLANHQSCFDHLQPCQ